MVLSFRIFYFGVIILSFLSCQKLKLVNKYFITPCYYDNPVKQADNPQHFLEISLDSYIKSLKKDTEFKLDTLKLITYQDSIYPIVGVSYKPEKATKKMLIFAGVHGNESGGVLAIPVLLDSIAKNKEKYSNWEIEIVTPINPVGLIYMSRYNECGCDPNRDFKKSTQSSIVLQREIIDSLAPDFIISLHESPSDGFFIFPSKHVNESISVAILDNLKENNIDLTEKDYTGRKLNPEGYGKLKFIDRLFKKIINMQTLENYTQKQNIPTITAESNWKTSNLKQRINSHVIAILTVIN